MKLTKGLLIGSAAMLSGVGVGAQAADLPVKAKAIEYVKICSLYGAGFYYIPGTDTCIRLGGYLRVWAGLHDNFTAVPADSGTNGAHNRFVNYYTARSREALNIDTRTATEYGVVRTYAQLVFTYTTGAYSGAGTAATNGATAYTSSAGSQIGGGTLGLYDAFIQFAGFTGHPLSGERPVRGFHDRQGAIAVLLTLGRLSGQPVRPGRQRRLGAREPAYVHRRLRPRHHGCLLRSGSGSKLHNEHLERERRDRRRSRHWYIRRQ